MTNGEFEPDGDVCGRLVVARHRGSRGLHEPVVQRPAERLIASETDVFEGPIEAIDRATVHLLMHALNAAYPRDARLVAEHPRICSRAAERFRPVRGEPKGVIRMEAAAEAWLTISSSLDPLVPCLGQPKQALLCACSLEYGLHPESVQALGAPVQRKLTFDPRSLHAPGGVACSAHSGVAGLR